MGQHSIPEIESSAEGLLRRAGALSMPVDIHKVAVCLDVKVHSETLEDQMSGVLVIKGSEHHILVNSAHHANRQRFTIAHELGHLVLHDTSQDRLFIDAQLRVYQRAGEPSASAYTDPNSLTTPQEEREANFFAAALLMPATLVRHAAFKATVWDEHDVASLAQSFGVSEQAMSIRLQRLGIVESFNSF